MPLPAIALLGFALSLQLYVAIRYLTPALRAGRRGRLAEGMFWFSAAVPAATLTIELYSRL